MAKDFETGAGGVMGYVAVSLREPHPCTPFCHDVEAKSGKTPVIPGPHELIQEAIRTAITGDREAHARAVMRSRWFPAID